MVRIEAVEEGRARVVLLKHRELCHYGTEKRVALCRGATLLLSPRGFYSPGCACMVEQFVLMVSGSSAPGMGICMRTGSSAHGMGTSMRMISVPRTRLSIPCHGSQRPETLPENSPTLTARFPAAMRQIKFSMRDEFSHITFSGTLTADDGT